MECFFNFSYSVNNASKWWCLYARLLWDLFKLCAVNFRNDFNYFSVRILVLYYTLNSWLRQLTGFQICVEYLPAQNKSYKWCNQLVVMLFLLIRVKDVYVLCISDRTSVTQYSLIGEYHCFWGTYYLHLLGCWRQHGSQKQWYTTTSLHDVRIQYILNVGAMRSSCTLVHNSHIKRYHNPLEHSIKLHSSENLKCLIKHTSNVVENSGLSFFFKLIHFLCQIKGSDILFWCQ